MEKGSALKKISQRDSARTAETPAIRAKPVSMYDALFDGDRLRQISWLIDIRAAFNRDMVRQ